MLPIIHNISLLISLVIVHSFFIRWIKRQGLITQVLSGLLFGVIAVIGMMSSFQYTEGVFFDGRSIILAVAGAFGGPVTAIVSAFVAFTYRMYLGGMGMTMGLLVIITSSVMGTIHFYLRKRNTKYAGAMAYLVLGWAVHLAMFLYAVALPEPYTSGVQQLLLFPLLVIYPLATMLVCLLFHNQEKQMMLLVELSESEQRWRNAFRNSPSVQMILDPVDGSILDANLAAERFYGWPLSELRKMRTSQINTLPEEELIKEIQKVSNKEKHYFQFQHKLASGDIRDVDIYAGPVSINNKEMILSIVHDVTDSRKNQEELSRERILLKTVIDNLPATVYVKDLQLRKILANKADIKIIGKPEDEIIGKTDREVFPDEQAKSFEDDDRRIIEQGESILNREERFVDENGQDIWLLTSKIPFRDSSGKIIGLIGVGRDITERVQALEEFRIAKEDADTSNKTKSEFLANISHEIRTPLNAILGFSEALYEQTATRAHQKMLQSILSSGKLLLALLNDILDLSKIEAGKMDIVKKQTDLRPLLEDLRLFFEEKAKDKGITFKLGFSEEFPRQLLIDEVRIKQVLFNLVGNAVKFTHKGQVSIDIFFVQQSKQTGTLCIQVSDTGIGIPKHLHEHIFSPFYQRSGQSSRKYGGTGLGLPISKRLVEQMQGHISLESEPDTGSVFTVSIPDVAFRFRKEEDGSSAQQQKKKYAFHAASVLIVDDVDTNRELLKILLSEAGLQVSEAVDGESALEQIRSRLPALILTDIRMPGMDGHQLAQKLKSQETWKSIPIIALTAYIHEMESSPENPGLFDDYLYKPIRRSDLLNKLTRHLKHDVILPEKVQEADDLTRFLPKPTADKKMLGDLASVLSADFYNEWEQVKDHWVLFKIEDFARRLRQVAETHQAIFLSSYASNLLQSVDAVDLESLRKQLSLFPRLILELENMAGLRK